MDDFFNVHSESLNFFFFWTYLKFLVHLHNILMVLQTEPPSLVEVGEIALKSCKSFLLPCSSQGLMSFYLIWKISDLSKRGLCKCYDSWTFLKRDRNCDCGKICVCLSHLSFCFLTEVGLAGQPRDVRHF